MYSENMLKDMFSVSRQTVRHAISVLENEGVIRRIQRSGTYINDNRLANLAKRIRVSIVTTYVDGLIVESTKSGIPNPNLRLYQEIRKRRIPVIFINSYYPQLSINDHMAGWKMNGRRSRIWKSARRHGFWRAAHIIPHFPMI